MTQLLVIRHPSFAAALALALALSSASATAQMNDPTRPPASFGTNAPDTGGGGIILQSVLISPTHRAAIINGVLVPVGGKYGGAVLVEVSEKEAVLRNGGTRQVLKLHPGVDMKQIGSADIPAADKAQSGSTPAR